MSIQASILNYFLKRYIKDVKKSPEESSYLDTRKLMNQKGYEDKNPNLGSKFLAKTIFGEKKSSINISESLLGEIRTLKFSESKFDQGKCILYFHGGAYIAGSPETHQNFLTALCEKSKTNIYAIDYALAPENKFPAALNDAVLSYKALLEIGYKSENIYFGGDSAGGNLVLVSILKLQETNQKLPAKAFLLSPWTNLIGNGESIKSNSEKDPYLSYDNFVSTSQSLKKTVEEWYAPNEDYHNPFISPVFANYESFPETLVQVSDIEILLSDSVDLVKNMETNDNKVMLSIYKNLPHVWQVFGFLPESKKAIVEISNFLNS